MTYTNRSVNMPKRFRLLPKSTTLDDTERPLRTVTFVFRSQPGKFERTIEDRATLPTADMNDSTQLQTIASKYYLFIYLLYGLYTR